MPQDRPDRNRDDDNRAGGMPNERAGHRIVGRMRERVTSELNARKDRASEMLGQLASGVRQMGQPFQEDTLPALGAIADKAASRIEEVAEGMRERDVAELADDVRGLARRRPAAFIAAGFATGLLAARFLKSSSEESPGPREQRPEPVSSGAHDNPGASTARRPARAARAGASATRSTTQQ
jgi:hypothetical protein